MMKKIMFVLLLTCCGCDSNSLFEACKKSDKCMDKMYEYVQEKGFVSQEKCILYINAAQQLCNASLGIATIGLLDEDF